MLVAIDTATMYTGLACYNQQGVLGECVWQSGRNHTAQLLPQLDLLLRQIGCTRSDLSAIGIALGPGSWSGLRVGLSAAKGLALACDLPLVGIGTLDTLVYQHRRPGMPIVPLIRLGRERFATLDLGNPESSVPRNVTLVQLCSEIYGTALFCGDIDADVQQTVRERLDDRAIFPAPAENVRRPAYLAELAWQRLQAGLTDDIAALEPLYLGQPVKSIP